MLRRGSAAISDCARAAGGRLPWAKPNSGFDEDQKFRALLREESWNKLPPSVRRRFSGRASAVYVGQVTDAWSSRAGWWLVQAARLIGAPLPLTADTGVPSTVTVTEDAATGGQIWTRLYAQRQGFPQIIHSRKRFGGPTGLEEHIGRGVGIFLTLEARERALVFRSVGYFLQVLGMRVALPGWITPGNLTVVHKEAEDRAFEFTLELSHRWFGRLVRQTVFYREFEA